METELAEILSELSEEELIRLMVRLHRRRKMAGLFTVIQHLWGEEGVKDLKSFVIDPISK